MRLIIDPKLANRLESAQLHPNRLFHCTGCNCNYQRNSVQKRVGQYYCLHCDQLLDDITNTDHGQQLAGILGL
jgi:late competence protein required for DNA uptake (superfamily II DNA/RNA helicase)